MSTAYKNRQIRSIAREFGLNMIASAPISSFYRANAVIRVQADTGTYALKPFIKSQLLRANTVKQIDSAAVYVQYLMECGYPYMTAWLPSNSGALWILSEGRPFYVTEWIQGRCMKTSQDFEQLGSALAALHAIPIGTANLKQAPALRQIQLWKAQDSSFRKTMARTSLKGEYRKWISRHGKTCKALSDWAWNELANSETVRLMNEEAVYPAIIHNDVTSLNVIVSDDGRLFLIDWDRTRMGSAYIDMAKAVKNTTQFNPEFIQAFLTGYEQHRPLGTSARKIIAAFYALPLEAWSAFRFPTRNACRKMLRMVNQTWQQRIKALEFVNEWADR